jgi:hypothetical protein
MATAIAGLLAAVTLAGGAALASSGVKGSPQPELKSFKIGASTTGGSVAIEPDGGLVVAYGIGAGEGETAVCVLARAGHACTHKTTLSPLSGDDLFGSTYAFISSANHVSVLQTDCCDSSTNGGDLLFTSANGGKSFGSPVRIGTMTASAAALVNGRIVFLGGDDGGGAQVESVPVGASGPPPSTATAIKQEAVDVGVGSYHNGVLIAADDDGSPDTTRVAYAPAGSDFDASSSYHIVGTFSGQSLTGISGGALVTQKTSGGEELELRMFNGSGFGAEHAVPHTKGGGPEWFGVDQDPSGRAHVFSESTHLSHDYDLYEQSTTTGAHWSGPLNLGNAIDAGSFAVALDARGSGLVLGTDPAVGFPVLGSQSVSFTLKHSSVRKGRSVTASGVVSPHGAGRRVELQVERSGRWYDVGSTHESSAGKFTFTIKGKTAGKHGYRAVVSDLAGYLLYGYSPARTLRVTS